ncbi:MAG: class I SAM-dependent methyltransferase [Patescibacteria group bacterium]|nr:class I SAM-dependent methyltransferase [Patescibacteria group bacterium]
MNFWDTFYTQPLDKIPWQNTQADWFKNLIDSGEVRGDSALDLGCGTGKKSVYLAHHEFKRVIGIDIAEKAVEFARQNAVQENVSNNCTFFAEDAIEWMLSNKESCDLVLDWAYLHCIDPERRNVYVEGIENVSHVGSFYLIRAFISHTSSRYFEEEMNGVVHKIYFLDEASIVALLPNFEIVKRNTSIPRTKPEFYFTELLMKKMK